MSEYGQSITPRWYQDTVPKQMSKINLGWNLHCALMQVGMIPIRSWNPFDFELPIYQEYDPLTTRNDLVFYYDYPTDETFEIGGLEYRPVFCMHIPVVYSGAVSSTTIEGIIRFEYGYRRADRLVRDDFSNLVRLHASTTNYGLGITSSGLSVTNNLSYASSCGLGAYYQKTDWRIFANSVDALRSSYLGVKNIHVILGKGGLTVQVGTGNTKTDSNDILSFTTVFGGARIPGRARIPAQDINLNKINPVFVLPHRHTGIEGGFPNYWTSSLTFEDVSFTADRPHSFALGCQHDLKIARGTFAGYTDRPGAVQLNIFNLENMERPLFPSPKAPTQNSPRNYDGSGAHILQPMIYAQGSLKTDSNDFYNVQNFDIRSQICPEWEDIWYAPKFRFADRNAPYGEYVDPISNLNWFLFRAEGVNTMMATEVEGIEKHVTFDLSTTFVEQEEDYFNLTDSAFAWSAGNPHQAAAATTSGVAWTLTPATDEATVLLLSGSSQLSTLTWTLEPYDGSFVDSSFTLQLDIMWKSVSAQSGINPLFVEYSNDDGTTWVTMLQINNTGTAAVPYNTYTATAEMNIWPGGTDNRIRFRIRTATANAVGGNRTAAIRNVYIRRYTRA